MNDSLRVGLKQARGAIYELPSCVRVASCEVSSDGWAEYDCIFMVGNWYDVGFGSQSVDLLRSTLTHTQLLKLASNHTKFLSEHFGVSEEDFKSWDGSSGRIKCHGTNRKGNPCQMMLNHGRGYFIDEYLKLKDTGMCQCHQNQQPIHLQ